MADNNDFFNDPNSTEESQTQEETTEVAESEGNEEAPEKLNVGDREFTTEELQELVGLGEKIRTFETKQGQKIDDVIKSWGDRGNRIGELEKRLSEREKQELEEKMNNSPDNLSQEERDRLARSELERLGYIPADQVKKTVVDQLQAVNYLNEVGDFIDQQKDEGKPEVTEQELLEYMQRKGMDENDYDAAYKEMFKSQIKVWEEQKIQSQKQPGMVTETSSTAGAKEPKPTRITRDNLQDMIDQSLRGQG